MKKDDFKTDVIFRREKDKSILAVFPYEISDTKGNCTCYAHIGQHSGLNWLYMRDTKPVKDKKEYTDLFRELTSIGYNLNVIKKRNYTKYLTALNKVRQ